MIGKAVGLSEDTDSSFEVLREICTKDKVMMSKKLLSKLFYCLI